MTVPFPTTTVHTTIGKLRIWATSDHHVGIATDPAHYDDGERLVGDPSVSINRVDYTLRFDIHKVDAERNPYKHRPLLAPDGTDTGWSYDYDSLILRRAGNYGDPSRAAYLKAIDILSAVLTGFLGTDEGIDLLADAGVKRTTDDIAKLTAEIEALDAKRAELVAKLDAMNGATV